MAISTQFTNIPVDPLYDFLSPAEFGTLAQTNRSFFNKSKTYLESPKGLAFKLYKLLKNIPQVVSGQTSLHSEIISIQHSRFKADLIINENRDWGRRVKATRQGRQLLNVDLIQKLNIQRVRDTYLTLECFIVSEQEFICFSYSPSRDHHTQSKIARFKFKDGDYSVTELKEYEYSSHADENQFWLGSARRIKNFITCTFWSNSTSRTIQQGIFYFDISQPFEFKRLGELQQDNIVENCNYTFRIETTDSHLIAKVHPKHNEDAFCAYSLEEHTGKFIKLWEKKIDDLFQGNFVCNSQWVAYLSRDNVHLIDIHTGNNVYNFNPPRKFHNTFGYHFQTVIYGLKLIEKYHNSYLVCWSGYDVFIYDLQTKRQLKVETPFSWVHKLIYPDELPVSEKCDAIYIQTKSDDEVIRYKYDIYQFSKPNPDLPVYYNSILKTTIYKIINFVKKIFERLLKAIKEVIARIRNVIGLR